MNGKIMKRITLILAVLCLASLCCACSFSVSSQNSKSSKSSSVSKLSNSSYEITLDAVGGMLSETKLFSEFGKNEELPVPTKTGYDFVGWLDSEENVYTNKNEITKNISLQAKWKATIYSITYKMMGGINNSANPKTFTIEDSFTLSSPTKDISDFIGWTTETDSNPKTNITIALGTTGDLIFTANWRVRSFEAKFVLLDGGVEREISKTSFTFGTAVVFPNAISFKPNGNTGEFSGWFLDKELETVINSQTYKMPPKEVTFYCSFGLPKYTVEVVDEAGKQISIKSFDEETESFTIDEAIKDGYTFVGYVSASNQTTTKTIFVPKGTTQNLEYTAIFTVNSATITFNSNGGSYVAPIQDECFAAVAAPTIPTKEPYQFLGWYTGLNDGSEYVFTTMPTKNIVLYARWSEIASYKLDLTVETSDGKPCEGLLIECSEASNRLSEGKDFTLVARMYYKGYDFEGWYIGNTLISKYDSINYTMPASELEVTAKYTACRYETYERVSNINLILQMPYTVTAVYGSAISQADYTISSTSLTIKASYLTKLACGDYAFLIDTTGGSYYYYVTIVSEELTNLRIDYDINYPNVTILFDGANDKSYTYKLNNGNSIAVNSGDIIANYNKAINNTLELFCQESDTSLYITKKAYNSVSDDYYNKYFTFNGNTYDYVVESKEELFVYIEYFALVESLKNIVYSSSYPFGKTEIKFYVESEFYTYFKTNLSELCKYAFMEFSAPHISQYQTVMGSGTNEGVSGLTFVFTSNANSETSSQQKLSVSDAQGLLKPSTRSTSFNDFFIDKQTKTQNINNVFELESLDYGVKPIIVSGSDVESLYNAVKVILRSIIDDNMSQFEKVEAIYNWLALNVTYDQYIVDNIAQSEYSAYRAFSSVGAIIDRVAVCDGYASAFKLMCVIEGINATEVTGNANGGGHAWNKVFIGGKCYGVDVTWARITGDDYAYVTHEYLFMNETQLRDEYGHYENEFNNEVIVDELATANYSYFEMQLLDGGFDLVIDSQAELTAVLNYMVNNNIKALEMINNIGSNFQNVLTRSLTQSSMKTCSMLNAKSTLFIVNTGS